MEYSTIFRHIRRRIFCTPSAKQNQQRDAVASKRYNRALAHVETKELAPALGNCELCVVRNEASSIYLFHLFNIFKTFNLFGVLLCYYVGNLTEG